MNAENVDGFRQALGQAAEHAGPVVIDLTAAEVLTPAALAALRDRQEDFLAVLVNMHSEAADALVEHGISRVAYQPRRRLGRLAATKAAHRNRAQRRWPHATAGTRSHS